MIALVSSYAFFFSENTQRMLKCKLPMSGIKSPHLELNDIQTGIQIRVVFVTLYLVHTGLIEQRKCAGSEEIVKERITKLQQQWEYLVQKSNEKSQHLKESNQQQQFNTNVKELDFWLGEVSQLNCFLPVYIY